MIHNALVLLAILVISYVITLCFWNSKKYKDFGAWWDAKGLSILILIGLAISVFGIIRNWFYRE
jgi:hypothetical protein